MDVQPIFAKGFSAYVCEGDSISVDRGGLTFRATVYRDDAGDAPNDRDDGFWPSRDKNHAGFVTPRKFKSAYVKAEKVMQAWRNDEWFFCGVAVTIWKDDMQITGTYDNALWGVECNYPDSDNSYLLDMANELADEASDAVPDAILHQIRKHAEAISQLAAS